MLSLFWMQMAFFKEKSRTFRKTSPAVSWSASLVYSVKVPPTPSMWMFSANVVLVGPRSLNSGPAVVPNFYMTTEDSIYTSVFEGVFTSATWKAPRGT